jgi:hypothetical protein
MHSYISPFTNLYINKIVWCIYVHAHDDTTFSTSTGHVVDTTYKDYNTNYKTTHPVITRIYAKPYVYRTGSETRQDYDSVSSISTNTVFTFGLFTEYPFSVGNGHAIDYCLFDLQNSSSTTITLFGRYNTASQNLGNSAYIYAVGIGDCKSNGNTSAFRIYQDENIDTVLENALRTIACFGFYFVLDTAYVNEPLDSEYVYMGVIPDNGITHGVYTHGTANRDNPNWGWSGSKDSPYDYTKPPGPVYDDSTSLPSLPLFSMPHNVYADGIHTLLYGLLEGVRDLAWGLYGEYFYGQEPLACIVGARRIFCRFPTEYVSREPIPVRVGKYEPENVSCTTLYTEWARYDLGTQYIEPYYENFLDYEPYTSLSLYVPYCGSMILPASVFIGHDCNITININIRTGDMQAIIFVDNIEYATMSGECSLELPINGYAIADYIAQKKNLQNQVYQGYMNMAMGTLGHFAGASISASMGNVAGVGAQLGMSALSLVEGMSTIDLLKWECDHLQPRPLEIQKAASEITAINCLTPYILVLRPKLMDDFNEENYSKTVGHACYAAGNLSDFHGFTQCIDALLDGISCTHTERLMIMKALQEGVILDG